MDKIHLRGLPFSFFSPYYGVNVRTYVTYKGKPGVYFLSLDANNRIAQKISRIWYRLNYFHAYITFEQNEQYYIYNAYRKNDNKHQEISIKFTPTSHEYSTKKNTLDYFLAERYCLYSFDSREDLYCVEIHHPQWLLQNVDVQILKNTYIDYLNSSLVKPPIVHYSKSTNVLVWNIRRL